LLQKVRELSKNLAIYGVGDVAIQIVSFLLVPLYVRYLTPADYGILGLLGGIEAGAKLFFRWGLDGSFMRFWYDCEDKADRRRLASTIFFFLLAVNAALLVLSLLVSPWVSSRLLGTSGYTLALQLVLLNTFAIGFTFIPFHVLRMQQRSREFSALTFSRSAATLLLRITLIVFMGLGIWGVVIADVVVTAGVMVWMLRLFAPLIRPVFSREVLRESLHFGLPRLPHALAQQVMAVGDRFILGRFGTLADIGVYSMSVSFGLIPKLFLGAFENAWAPFYYAAAREPDGARTLAGITTYVFAVLALLTAGLSAIGRDLLALVAGPDYAAGGSVVAWTAVGVLLQGVYLLTSIGLNITRNTRYYPVATIAGAACNVGLNFLWIPRFGIVGAAWANAAAYAVQTGIAWSFSRRFYPIPYERGRLARVAAAAAIGYAAAWLVPETRPFAGILIRGTVVVVVTAALLATSGFFRAGELRTLDKMMRRRRAAAPAVARPVETIDMAGELVATDIEENAVRDEAQRS
jgi:O-antigen/teichoic acid export membrane protein